MRETGASPEVPNWYLEMPGSSKVSDSASRESRVPRRLAVYWGTRGSLERLHSYPKTPVSRASLNRLGILRYQFSIWRHSRVSQEANGLSGHASLGRIFAYTEDNLVSQETISYLERPKRCGDARQSQDNNTLRCGLVILFCAFSPCRVYDHTFVVLDRPKRIRCGA